jgi:flagellar basal-body rod protein FlgB
MTISNIPLFSMLRSRMHWHQERQRVLAENVANADTPGFQARDLTPPKFDAGGPAGAAGGLGLVRTHAAHVTPVGGDGSRFQAERRVGFDSRPSGNAVNLEDEMLKVASNQMDYQAATSLYSRGLGMLKTAIGRRA